MENFGEVPATQNCFALLGGNELDVPSLRRISHYFVQRVSSRKCCWIQVGHDKCDSYADFYHSRAPTHALRYDACRQYHKSAGLL